jgi:hypothetical protein
MAGLFWAISYGLPVSMQRESMQTECHLPIDRFPQLLAGEVAMR